MPRVLITGGSGYLGRELVRLGLAAGWDVTATYASRMPQPSGARLLPLDLRQPGAALALVRAAQPQIVIHTAYVQGGPDLAAITAQGPGEVAAAARSVGARLIHLSSDALFDGESQRPYTEDDQPSPITPYGQAKADAERAVAQAHPAALIVRTSLIYGGPTPSPHEQMALDAVDSPERFTFFTDELRNPVLVADLAAALVELAPTSRSGILHVAGAHTISRHEFACRIARAAGKPADALRAGSSAASGLRRPRHVAMDSSRAQSILRTQLRGVRDLLPA